MEEPTKNTELGPVMTGRKKLYNLHSNHIRNKIRYKERRLTIAMKFSEATVEARRQYGSALNFSRKVISSPEFCKQSMI